MNVLHEPPLLLAMLSAAAFMAVLITVAIEDAFKH